MRKKVVPDLIFFTAQSENITFSKYAFYFINNSLYFITLYIIKCHTETTKKVLMNPLICIVWSGHLVCTYTLYQLAINRFTTAVKKRLIKITSTNYN